MVPLAFRLSNRGRGTLEACSCMDEEEDEFELEVTMCMFGEEVVGGGSAIADMAAFPLDAGDVIFFGLAALGVGLYLTACWHRRCGCFAAEFFWFFGKL